MKYTDNINNLEVIIDDSILEKMIELSMQSCPNETGGFLIGNYSNDLKIAYITNMLIPSAISSCNSYKRETLSKSIWDKLYNEGKIYLGEWHSHPNGCANYSQTDKNTLISIANNDNVNILNPIIIIIGIKYTKIEVKVYYLSNANLIEYEKD